MTSTTRCSSGSFFGATLLGAGLLAASFSPALAVPVTFAQFIQQNGAAQEWSISTSGTSTTVNASGLVYFSFSGVTGLPFSGPELANFSLTATSTQLGSCGVGCGPGDSFVQPGYAGTFSFTDAGAAPGTNLLSGVFSVTGSPATTGAQFSSSIGSSGGSFNASSTEGNLLQLVFSSDYVTFPNATNENASFSLSSLIPNFDTDLVVAGRAYPAQGTFNAAGSGTFSSNPGPVSITDVPEPASMLLLGASLAGVTFARRRRAV